MSKRIEVLAAVKALVTRALPGATVRGMSAEEAKPTTVGPLGMVIVRSGDPGTPEVDLSPPVYWYTHGIPLEIAAYQSGTTTSQEVIDAMLVAIGGEIALDRTLGGLCIYLEGQAPSDGETDTRGATPMGWADVEIVATYSTTSPLG